jgi:hypothetical protein
MLSKQPWLTTGQNMPINANTLSIDLFHKAEVYAGKGDKLRKKHLCSAYDQSTVNGLTLEFGVFQGFTLNALARYIAPEKIYGFDSFQGLPEDWNLTDSSGLSKGFFQLDNLPATASNAELVVGWFEQTLPDFLNQHSEPVRCLHIDADLYSSTIYVLRTLNDKIVPGTVIVFDELYNWDNPAEYTNWHQGEFQALKDWMQEFNRTIDILWRTDCFHASVVVRS